MLAKRSRKWGFSAPAKISIVPHDPQWPAVYAREEERMRAALGNRGLRIEHAGSTSVPGLAAKPVIDVVLAVADSADESAYVPLLQAAGYRLRIREPHWFEHRMLKGTEPEVNLHVFSSGCPEVDRMIAFRDWLRANPTERELYQSTKIALAHREWNKVQDYADAKTAIVNDILARAIRL